MKALHKNILERLDQIINDTGDHIHDFINNHHAFTRKRTLDAATVLKTTINMQGQNLNSELFRAFGEDATKKNDKVVSTSAYVQRKSQLSPACFKHILTVFNQGIIESTYIELTLYSTISSLPFFRLKIKWLIKIRTVIATTEYLSSSSCNACLTRFQHDFFKTFRL